MLTAVWVDADGGNIIHNYCVTSVASYRLSESKVPALAEKKTGILQDLDIKAKLKQLC